MSDDAFIFREGEEILFCQGLTTRFLVAKVLDGRGHVAAVESEAGMRATMKLDQSRTRDFAREALLAHCLTPFPLLAEPIGFGHVVLPDGGDGPSAMLTYPVGFASLGAFAVEPEVAAGLVGLAALAVHHLHLFGLAHLDVKLDNFVAITDMPFLSLIDLGSVRAIRPDIATRVGARFLIEPYATTIVAPEEALALASGPLNLAATSHEGIPLGPAPVQTDIFKLGALGASLFFPDVSLARSLARLREAAVHEDPILRVLARAASPDPADRPASTLEIADAVAHAGLLPHVPPFTLLTDLRDALHTAELLIGLRPGDPGDPWVLPLLRYLAENAISGGRTLPPGLAIVASFAAASAIAQRRPFANEARVFAFACLDSAAAELAPLTERLSAIVRDPSSLDRSFCLFKLTLALEITGATLDAPPRAGQEYAFAEQCLAVASTAPKPEHRVASFAEDLLRITFGNDPRDLQDALIGLFTKPLLTARYLERRPWPTLVVALLHSMEAAGNRAGPGTSRAALACAILSEDVDLADTLMAHMDRQFPLEETSPALAASWQAWRTGHLAAEAFVARLLGGRDFSEATAARWQKEAEEVHRCFP